MPKKWDYGGFNEKWKVEEGDIWQITKDDKMLALLRCGRLEDSVRFVKEQAPACLDPIDLAYVDPPWNLSNIRSFYTKAGKDGKAVVFNEFLDELFSLVILAPTACIEMGRENEQMVLKRMEALWPWTFRVHTTYYRKNPAFLLIGSIECMPLALEPLKGMDDERTPGKCIEIFTKEDDVVFDCCMGRGLTLRSALSAGRRFVGIELNPARFACCLEWAIGEGYSVRRLVNDRSK